MIRVAFTAIGGKDWLGGGNYLRNLIEVLTVHASDAVTPVFFVDAGQVHSSPAAAGPKAEIKPLAGLGANRNLSTVRAILFGSDQVAARVFGRERIDAVFEVGRFFGSRFPFPVLSWFADFQHKRMPHLFRKTDLWKRDALMWARISAHRTLMLSSRNAEQDCVHFFPEAAGRTAVVPFAVNCLPETALETADAIRAKYQLPDRYFFLPNQFWRHKNHGLVLKALERLQARGVRVAIAASGLLSDIRNPDHVRELRARIEAAGLAGSFQVLGVIPYPDVIGLMRGAIALINPSEFEGWSTSVEEAKAYGTPMLLSDLGVHREQAGAAAEYFSVRDDGRLADLLEAAWSRGILNNRVEREAQARIDQEKRVKAFALAFVSALETAIDDFRRRP